MHVCVRDLENSYLLDFLDYILVICEKRKKKKKEMLGLLFKISRNPFSP